MSTMTMNKKGEITFNKSGRGIRDIPDTVRRGLRMTDSQRRFALTVSTVLVFILILAIIFASGAANNTVAANEKALALEDVMGAERIEMGKKTIELTAEHGTKTIDTLTGLCHDE